MIPCASDCSHGCNSRRCSTNCFYKSCRSPAGGGCSGGKKKDSPFNRESLFFKQHSLSCLYYNNEKLKGAILNFH